MCVASDSGTGETQVGIRVLPSQGGFLVNFFIVKTLPILPIGKNHWVCGGLPLGMST